MEFLLVSKLSFNEASQQLVPEMEKFKLFIPPIKESNKIEPELILLNVATKEKSIIHASTCTILNECSDASAFYFNSFAQNCNHYFWIYSNSKDFTLLDFEKRFREYKTLYLSLNLNMGNILRNYEKLIDSSDISSIKFMATNPYFTNHAHLFEIALQTDPSMVDYKYAEDLASDPSRTACVYDYLCYLYKNN